MPKHMDASNAVAAFVHDSTLVAAVELSGQRWEIGAVVPGVARRPRRLLAARDMMGLLAVLGDWRREAAAAGRPVRRVVLTYEAGRDGFWIARCLQAQGIEVHVMHPASIPVPRRQRRAKTDRIDLDMLLRTLLAWLRGEPRVCTMAPIPSVAEEDERRPGRERERLVGERLQLENRIEGLLSLHGVADFNPRLKKAAGRLEALRCFDGTQLPDNTMAALRRMLARHRLACAQIAEIEAERDRVASDPAPDAAVRTIQQLMLPVGVGGETATALVREAFCRPFAGPGPLASFCGLTGNPFKSGGLDREQGIGGGHTRLRRLMVQFAWRWLRFQPTSELSLWFHTRTQGAGRRSRKIMIVALARKLLVALWRYVRTGEVPAGARLHAR